MLKINYRPEIDGLRAWAVLSVLVFHFYPSALPYGFLGVDLFFVISGYLIATYIFVENEKKQFSFSIFYLRRVKRILPVTLIVLSATFLFSLPILIGADLTRFLKSLLSTVTFTANVFFWRDGGYFAANDALKPLLHMWSLGVEEQFYLLFPLVFFLILKYIRASMQRLLAVSLISILSFGCYFFLLNSGGANPAFFLTPFRAWQFGAGVIAALIYQNYGFAHRPIQMCLALFVLLLGCSVAPNLIAPGFLVTVSTAFFLSRRYVHVRYVSAYFSNAIIQKIGFISFSLYLWHWPILVFIKYITVDSPSELVVFFGLLITVALSILSYIYIEKPFRELLKPTTALRFSVSLIVILMVSAFAILHSHSLDKNVNQITQIAAATQTNFRCEITEYLPYGRSRACVINKDLSKTYEIALIGNSHAQMYVPSIQGLLRTKGERGLLIPLNGCLPTTDININADCLRLARLNYEAFIADTSVKTVVFGLTWYQNELFKEQFGTISDPNRTVLSKSLIDLVKKVESTGRKVFLIGPLQIPNYDLPSVLSRRLKFGHLTNKEIDDQLRVSRVGFDREFGEAITLLSTTLGDQFILPSQVFCDSQFCYYGGKDGIYFADSNHLSRVGSMKVAGVFQRIVRD
jgi:peptidoglycan/LPS O-acetylase OafA/YrhL